MSRILRNMFLSHLVAVWVLGLGAAAVFAQVSESVANRQPDIARETFHVQLGDFTAEGELTYPSNQEGPFPAIVLVHGSGPADMDNTVAEFDMMSGQPVIFSANFRDIAERLSSEGFAVLRYNKRYVLGPNNADTMRYYTGVDLHTLLADLAVVVDFARHHPLVDAGAVYLYGWSEGSTVAAQFAADDPELAGLILQTPVVDGWRETFEFQVYETGIEYLRSVTGGEPVTQATLFRIMSDAEAGMVARSIVNFIADGAAFQTGNIAVNSVLDVNGDGTLDLETEVIPGLGGLLDFAFGPYGPFAIYAPERALPVVAEQVGTLQLPVLILQGAEDANVPAAGAVRLAEGLEQSGVDVTLHVYEGLGHSLGPAADRQRDRFQPIAEEALADLVAWLRTQTRRN